VKFLWVDSGRKGAITKASEPEAIRARAEIIEASERNGSGLEITVTNRETGEELPMPPKCIRCTDRYAHPFEYEYRPDDVYCRPCGTDVREEREQQADIEEQVDKLITSARNEAGITDAHAAATVEQLISSVQDETTFVADVRRLVSQAMHPQRAAQLRHGDGYTGQAAGHTVMLDLIHGTLRMCVLTHGPGPQRIASPYRLPADDIEQAARELFTALRTAENTTGTGGTQ
jgi:hypothetical protein